MFSPHAYVNSRSLFHFSPSIPPSVSLPFPFLDVWASGSLSWEVKGLDVSSSGLGRGGGIRAEWEKLGFQGWTEPSGEFALSSSRPFCWCITIAIKGEGHGGKVLFLSSLPPILLIGKTNSVQYSHLLLFLWCWTAEFSELSAALGQSRL